MKAPKEIKNWINRIRRKRGKPNGVIHIGALDNPDMERKHFKSKKNYNRCRDNG